MSGALSENGDVEWLPVQGGRVRSIDVEAVMVEVDRPPTSWTVMLHTSRREYVYGKYNSGEAAELVQEHLTVGHG